MTPCPYSRKFSNGVLFVCTLEANHKGDHLMWRIELRARAEGRADGVAAVAIRLHWTAAQMYRVAKSCGVSFEDARAALIRARDCTHAEVDA